MHSPSARQDGSASVELSPEAQGPVREALRAGRSIRLHWTIGINTGRTQVSLRD
jgi:hypothetical protein